MIRPLSLLSLALPLLLMSASAEAQRGDRDREATSPTRASADRTADPPRGRTQAERAPTTERSPGGTVSEEQKGNVAKLRDDLQALGNGVKSAEDEIRDLATDLQGMGLQKPDPASTQQLARDLQSALSDASLSPQEMLQLSQSLAAVMDSAGMSMQELQQIQDDVEAILIASGVSRNDVEAILRDLEAIWAAANPGARSGSGPPPSTDGKLRDRVRNRG